EKLTVISRTSAMQYKGTHKTVPEIARELHVDAVIEGTVMRSSGRIRISTELIHGTTARVLWAKSYDRDFANVLALQNDVARAIAGEIGVNLSPQVLARLTTERPVNPQAQEEYLKGRYYRYRRGLEATRTSVGHFQQAIDLDPNYAPALAGLADAYGGLATYAVGFLNPNEAFPKARELALKALEIDSGLSEAHVAMAVVNQQYDWDWVGAEQQIRRAIELNPGYFEAYHTYSHFLTAVGRTAESLAASQRALDLDPLALPMNAHLGFHYHFARDD